MVANNDSMKKQSPDDTKMFVLSGVFSSSVLKSVRQRGKNRLCPRSQVCRFLSCRIYPLLRFRGC